MTFQQDPSCHVFSGPCEIIISGEVNVLNYKGKGKDSHIFGIPGIDTVLIYDFRPETRDAMKRGATKHDYSRVVPAFERPGMVEIGHEEGVYYVEIRPLSGPAKLALKLLGKKTIWIATNVGQFLPKREYLITEHHQNHTGKFSLFCLYSR